MLRFAPFATAIVAALCLAASASAVPIANLITIQQDNLTPMVISETALGCVQTKASVKIFECDGSGQTIQAGAGTGSWELSDWNMTFDLDPFVSLAFGFKNTGAAATFTIATSIPVIAFGPSSLMGGSTGGSITDSNFDGLGGLSTAAPDAFFVGLIDGVPVVPAAELHPDPLSLTFLFPGGTTSIPTASFGLPGPTVPGPAVAASIGIRNRFILSGGDSVASTNFFVVDPVPEPGTGALLGLGLAAMATLRRRS